MAGIIIKGIAGFYYVKCGNTVYECKARGVFKKRGLTPAVGDDVLISLTDEEGKGVIEEILPRKNSFIRPPIANIDCFIVVMAAKNPDPNYPVIDRFLVMAENSGTDIILCVNKSDLADEERLSEIQSIYGNVYDIVFTEAVSGKGVDEIRKRVAGKRAAFAGPSGAGKSTMLNAIIPDAGAETGDISKKTKRGRHTTRHVEIFEIEGGGMIYDTPGFTSFDILEVDEDELDLHYPEMEKYKGQCYYDDCRHIKEPDCAVRRALEEGKISKVRYASYVSQLEEIREKKKKY